MPTFSWNMTIDETTDWTHVDFLRMFYYAVRERMIAAGLVSGGYGGYNPPWGTPPTSNTQNIYPIVGCYILGGGQNGYSQTGNFVTFYQQTIATQIGLNGALDSHFLNTSDFEGSTDTTIQSSLAFSQYSLGSTFALFRSPLTQKANDFDVSVSFVTSERVHSLNKTPASFQKGP